MSSDCNVCDSLKGLCKMSSPSPKARKAGRPRNHSTSARGDQSDTGEVDAPGKTVMDEPSTSKDIDEKIDLDLKMTTRNVICVLVGAVIGFLAHQAYNLYVSEGNYTHTFISLQYLK